MDQRTRKSKYAKWAGIFLWLFVGGMLSGCAGLFGQSDTGPNYAAPNPFARVGQIPDHSDVPDELLFPKKLPRLADQDRERLGDILLKRGDFAGAYVQFEKVLIDEPDNLRVQYKKGLTLLYGQQYPEAASVFEQVLAHDPDHALAHLALGQTYLELDRLEAAEEHLRSALELTPGRWDAHNLLGNIFDRQKRYDEAVQEYHAALQISPSQAKLYNNLGVSYLLRQPVPPSGPGV